MLKSCVQFSTVGRVKGQLCELDLAIGNLGGDAGAPAGDQFVDRRMVFDVLVQLGHQRALAIPFVRADDMHTPRGECVGGTHHRADVEIVRPILHRHLEPVAAPRIQVGLDGVDRPVAVPVEHVAPVAFVQ